MNKPELLAPAGSREALVAAVQNGADAVYVGGQRFNARHSAANFDDRELAEVIEYAHGRGVKVFVAVNILVAESELKEAVRFLHTVYKAGADAVIVQDLGLIKLARQMLPQLELHASTQMTAHNVPGVEFLKAAGIQRVVLARELDLEAIRGIKEKTGMQLEVFVHGALCICYSGQCLMSSLIGGRSGNRGRCAQPCRLPYQLVDDRNRPLVDSGQVGEYLLSPRDLNLSRHLPELIKAGIDAFKIEGRMRRPEYVAIVTGIYRRLIDRAVEDGDYVVTDEEWAELTQVFNREFSTGYFFDPPDRNLMSYKRPNNRGTRLGRVRRYHREKGLAEVELEAPLGVGDGIEVWVTRGGRVGVTVAEIYIRGQKVTFAPAGTVVNLKLDGYIQPGDRVFKTHDFKLMERAVQSYSSSRETMAIPLSFRVWASPGQPLTLEVTDPQGHTARAQTGVTGEVARKKPLTREFLASQLDRLGNTPFSMQHLECDLAGEVMIPVREINEVRRKAVEELLARRSHLDRPAPLSGQELERELKRAFDYGSQRRSEKFPRLAVALSSFATARVAVQSGAQLIYFSGDFYRRGSKLSLDEIKKARDYCGQAGVEFYLTSPRILHDVELVPYLSFLESALKTNPDGVLLSGYGLIKAVAGLTGVPLVTDFGLNVFNRQSALFLRHYGVERVTLSPELTGEQIAYLAGFIDVDTEVMVHGALPLMVTRYCGVGSLLGGREKEKPCGIPCRGATFALRDRKGMIFPVETDANCLMHIFNAKELCLLETLPTLARVGPAVLRIEARRGDERYVQRTVQTYRQALDGLYRTPEELTGLTLLRQELMGDAGYTRGHYYRGVLDD